VHEGPTFAIQTHGGIRNHSLRIPIWLPKFNSEKVLSSASNYLVKVMIPQISMEKIILQRNREAGFKDSDYLPLAGIIEGTARNSGMS
jgi:hypothetical protein